ncbi:regulator of protease activity HflC (stomatin/prohibitin superfamily) [Thermolongibacillus altinsuensis]|uniref:Regulator of protease activity HflC (Stomatin/prohibitin superfamily) n=1 Tax=Thermolongibacillus altinsuensis TaxID=575256 RepID=A0A4R1Q6Z9_9BACL|nr:SPFH domain-containing protein [Thermolongibacillus altinsuensis]TCL43643.1 regulator of protease activity HflC (stomatin/prohibitin superfamily) [Thermolongibacillus altinsuensis]
MALLGGAILSILHQVIISAVLCFVLAIVLTSGITIVQPNQAKVVTFFGRYLGSIRDSGLFLTIPLTIRPTVSLRVRNFNSNTLKVNDVEGTPIEIAAVIVFKVVDSAKAVFDVENYEKFVEIQSETAIRHVATKYPYDTFENHEITLRGNADVISEVLAKELQERLTVAGVEVVEARLSHLAYSPEIASAMLQRQQAAAILAARKKIVEGAVSMAQMAIEQLDKEGILELDDERKANMVNNLMVAIVSERATQPVINTGSLY